MIEVRFTYLLLHKYVIKCALLTHEWALTHSSIYFKTYTMLSDGEHYYNVRHLEKKGDTISALLYMKELSKPKRRALERALNTLSRHEMFRNTLDKVMEFKGLWSSLEIS